MNNRDILYKKREEIINDICFFRRKLVSLENYLNDINNKICKIDGCDFGPWNKTRGNDKKVYYFRKCKVCGKIERTFDEPALYLINENGKCYSKVRKKEF